VIDGSPAPGRQANAAACIPASVGPQLPALLGADIEDADGFRHPVLPSAGCSILAADVTALNVLRNKAAQKEDVFIVNMAESAQTARSVCSPLATASTNRSGNSLCSAD
jgi:hypothetical protein